MRSKWTFSGRTDHCPGDCYSFCGPGGYLHIPVDMFWGRIPWRWDSTLDSYTASQWVMSAS